MTEPAPPLDAEQMDELISADLDGEFDAAARDIGLDPAHARARLEATPGVTERRRALAGARDVLAEPVVLDDVSAARLRSRALQAATPGKPRRVWMLAGSIAAAVVLVAGVLAVVGRGTETAKQANSSAGDVARPATGGVATTGTLPGVNFGAVDSLDALHGAYMSLQNSSAKQAVGASAPDSTLASPASPDQALRATASLAANGVCDAAARANSRVTGAPIVRGYATLVGEPVIVLVFAGQPQPVMVVLRTDCRVLNRVVLPPKG
jgi:hypothetical protein